MTFFVCNSDIAHWNCDTMICFFGSFFTPTFFANWGGGRGDGRWGEGQARNRHCQKRRDSVSDRGPMICIASVRRGRRRWCRQVRVPRT